MLSTVITDYAKPSGMGNSGSPPSSKAHKESKLNPMQFRGISVYFYYAVVSAGIMQHGNI